MININNKEWGKLRLSDIQKHLSGDDDESFFFEYKEDDVKPDHLIKEVSAFANTYGGYIIIGVNDNKEIIGCSKWTEQRISTTIHDSLTPIPVFDVKKIKTPNSKILIIKIEEGTNPPYITGKGYIYERISSGSFPIKESYKLSKLYDKKTDNLKKIDNKIKIDDFLSSELPSNLCATLDIGFSINWNDNVKVYDTFMNTSPTLISEYLNSKNTEFSISKIGFSYIISVGRIDCSQKVLIPANSHQFMEIMSDGSMKLRIPLYSANNADSKADITPIINSTTVFKDIYSIFWNDLIKSGFISAYRYEKLKVYRQFTPYYNLLGYGFEEILNTHNNKYGNNLVITSTRFPKNDFELIDKRVFNSRKVKYNNDNLKNYLFQSIYTHLGYVDNYHSQDET